VLAACDNSGVCHFIVSLEWQKTGTARREMIETLISEKNPLLKDVRRAASQGTLTDAGFAIAEGFHLLDEAIASETHIEAVIAAESAQPQTAERTSKLANARLISVPDALFSSLTTTFQPQGVITLVLPTPWDLRDIFRDNALAVILDGVQDPGNAGAVVRCAEAFGASGVVFLKGAVNPYNPKCLRGSAGSVFRMPIVHTVNIPELWDAVHRAGAILYAATPRDEQPIDQVDWNRPCGVITGGEGAGVRDALTERAVEIHIPTTGVESLNAAVACGVILYEAQRQRAAHVPHRTLP
jgi:RNA methyltransferase, TrmH family